MLEAFDASQAKGYNAAGITRAFLAYGVATTLPRTAAGKSCQDYLELVDERPREGELMLVPTVMAGHLMTLDELAAQETQFIIEVLMAKDYQVTLQFRGAIRANSRSGQDLPHGEEFTLSYDVFNRIDYFLIRPNLPESWFTILVDEAMEEDRSRQATRRATPRGGDPTTPSARSTVAGPAVTSSSSTGKGRQGDRGRGVRRGREESEEEGEWEGRSRRNRGRDRFRDWHTGEKGQDSREGSGQRGRRHSKAWDGEEEDRGDGEDSGPRGRKTTRTWDVESGGEDADDGSLVDEDHTAEEDGGKKKKKAPVQPVVQAWSVNTLDEVSIIVQSKKDQQAKVTAIQGFVRLTTKIKWLPLLFDGIFDQVGLPEGGQRGKG
jgi:hypothetical protein